MTNNFKLSQQLSFGEEVANSVTHGIGAIMALAALPATAIYTHIHHNGTAVIGMSIFVISLFLMFMSSCIYHAMAYNSLHKRVLRIIDHSMIYIAIAGSYTPMALSLVGGWLGITIIALQWGITIFGILYKIFAKEINEKFSLTLYLIMGWLVVVILPVLLQKTTGTFWFFLVAGGLAYTVGAIFYAQKKPYFHMIWHLFIILASVLHFIGIVFYMLP